MKNNLKENSGFSVVELLLVAVIIATLSVTLILNFRASPLSATAREQTASVIVSDVRRAQSMALAASLYRGSSVCGYGIHYVDSNTYLIYAGAWDSGVSSCQSSERNYSATADTTVETKKLSNGKMEMRSSFPDVFFVPPDPKTFINNSSALADPPAVITIQPKGQSNCGQGSCTTIEIYTSGLINLIN